jgi:alpha-galactosidase
VTGYYAWLDELRAAHPELTVENCSSGGMRLDLGIIAHSHTTWLSDGVLPQASAQLAYGCTVEFAPEICNHWMVGDDERGYVDAAKPPGWWDYMFRVAMNGQFGISSRVWDWTAQLKQRAAENIALYKRLRTVIDGADVYHLTAQPLHNDPGAWMAIQYVAPDAQRGVLLAYRLGRSLPQQIFKLRGLTAGQYEVVEDGQLRGTFTAKQLAAGLAVKLDAEWRAGVIELKAVPR